MKDEGSADGGVGNWMVPLVMSSNESWDFFAFGLSLKRKSGQETNLKIIRKVRFPIDFGL